MNRYRLVPALLAAVALTLSACSSTAGTATAADSSSSSPTGVAETSDTSDTATSDATDTSTEEPSDTGTSTESAASTTAVTVDGTMDAQSTAWFGSMCEGVSPMIGALFGAMGTMTAGADAAAAKKAQTSLVDAFDKAGEAMAAAGSKLSSLPPPSIDHGAEIASEAAAALAKSGPALKQVADALSKATITSMEDLSTAMEKASSGLETDLDGLSLNSFELSDSMQAQVAKIPACAPLMALGSAAGSGSAAPTS